jgi:hypothetical protein
MVGEGIYPALQGTLRSGFIAFAKRSLPPNRRTLKPFNGAYNPFKIGTLK